VAQVVLRVEGMSCGHCKNAVEKSLKGVSGVQEAVADLEAKTVTIAYAEREAVRSDFEKAITEAGYEVVN